MPSTIRSASGFSSLLHVGARGQGMRSRMPKCGMTRAGSSRTARRRCTCRVSAASRRPSTPRAGRDRNLIAVRAPRVTIFVMRFAPLGLCAVLAACAHGNDGSAIDAAIDAPGATQDSDMSCGGLPCDAIYVAPSGNDTGTGTRSDPLKTIGAAVTKAAARVPAVGVYAQVGDYNEQVTMKAGVDVFGGYDTSWMPTTTGATAIIGPATGAVTIDAITVATGLHHLTVKSADAQGAGASSFAVLV